MTPPVRNGKGGGLFFAARKYDKPPRERRAVSGNKFQNTKLNLLFFKRSQSMNDATVKKDVAMTAQMGREPVKLLRRIGSTTVEVTVHFSNTSKETLEDKLLRMIGREVEKNA
jgi:hypothetical protein